MASPVAAETAAESPLQPAPRRALFGWVLYDWATQPFYTLVLTFLFAPYFASAVVGDVAKGQAWWGYAAALAGVIIAIGSPLLGAMADGGRRRKPWVALFVAVLASCMASLWLARPGADGVTVLGILAAFVVATAAAEFAVVFTNAIMTTLVPKDELGRLSGIGWATGYAGGLASLILMTGFLVAVPNTGKTFFGLEPLLKLDLSLREGDRLVGPFAACWLLVFVLPFFLFVPERRSSSAPRRNVSPFAELFATLRSLPSHRDMLFFLLGRALYTDGLSAIFVFGGIYGTSIFGWQATEQAIFGIILTVVGALGAVIGGFLDDRVGSRRVILLSLLLLLIGCCGILSVTASEILFSQPVAPKSAGSKPFSSVGEQTFLGFAMLVALVAAPNQASSRALLARLAPPDRMTQYFGLFAFSGKVTAFMAPSMVAVVTNISGSQRLGMAAILIFLIAGILLMLPIREPRTR